MSTDLECGLLSLLNGHLEKHQFHEAVTALKNEKFSDILKNKSWELIPTICTYLNEDSSKNSPDLVQCCRELLLIVAQNANPEEVVLELIELADCPNNDVLFISLLEPLITVHMRLPRRRGDTLKWVLNVILGHVRGLPLPSSQSYEGTDERKLMDLDPDVIRINTLYSCITDCLKPMLKEVSSRTMNDTNSFDEITTILTVFIFLLIGGPVSNLDLSYDGKVKSEARVSVEILMKYFACMSYDMFSFLEHVENLQVKSSKKLYEIDNNDEYMDVEGDIFSINKIPEKCFAMVYYLLLGEKIEFDKTPYVYSHFYIFQCCIYLSTSLFNPNEEILMLKGLTLAKVVIEMQVDSSVTYEALDSPVHSTFQKSVINSMVYCVSRECRTLAVKVLELYLQKFDVKGKYMVFSSMLSSVDHAGLAGFLLVQLKDVLNNFALGVNRNMEMNATSGSCNDYFSGKNLLALLLSPGGCSLAHGAETDLLEASDQILSALNLLRFLSIRDSKNVTGFWDHVPVLRKKYLVPLREGIDLSRAHYQVKLKDLKEEKRLGKKKSSESLDVTVTIVGQNLPHLPVDKKILVVESALNTFDLIESLMGRLNECLECGSLKS